MNKELSNPNTDNSRIVSVDILKGLLILCVCLGHTYFVYGNVLFWFHIPAFFFMSGINFKVQGKDYGCWIKNKAIKLFPAYLLYVFLYEILQFQGSKRFILNVFKAIYGGRMYPYGFWFITCLFISLSLFLFVELNIKGKKKYLIYGFMFLIGFLESSTVIPHDSLPGYGIPSYLNFPWNVDVCLFAAPFIALGYYNKNRFLQFLEAPTRKQILAGGG